MIKYLKRLGILNVHLLIYFNVISSKQMIYLAPKVLELFVVCYMIYFVFQALNKEDDIIYLVKV